MTETDPNGLVLRLVGEERQPGYPIDCLEFVAMASAGPFRGQTTFSVYKRDLDAFLDELDAMVATLAGVASIRCGWGEDTLFEMKYRFVVRLGGIAVHLDLADSGERTHRLSICFKTEPLLLGRFATGLRRAAENGDRTAIRLAEAGR